MLKPNCFLGSYSSTDDRLYTHEAAGILAGGEDNPEEQQLAYLSTLMQPLLAQIEQYLPLIGAATQGQATQNGRPPPDPVGMVLQVIIFVLKLDIVLGRSALTFDNSTLRPHGQ